MRWSLKFCISHKFSGDGDAEALGPTLSHSTLPLHKAVDSKDSTCALLISRVNKVVGENLSFLIGQLPGLISEYRSQGKIIRKFEPQVRVATM